jgi:hypothetical protein
MVKYTNKRVGGGRRLPTVSMRLRMRKTKDGLAKDIKKTTEMMNNQIISMQPQCVLSKLFIKQT